MKTLLIAIAATISSSLTVHAQPLDADVKSVDAIIAALYEVISGEAGAPRNWERFKHLFAADAKLIPTNKTADNNFSYRAMTPTDYANLFATRITTGFYEREIHRQTDEYGTIVHLFSTYATKQTLDGADTNRGINSIQLLKTADRYYIMNIFWCAESLGFPLPDKYLQ